jgi:hypothetical protein
VKTGVDPQMLIDEVKKFAAAEKSRGSVGTRFIPQATKWLNEQRWADHAAVAALEAIGDPPQLDWEKIVGFYARNGFWSRHAGPEPGLTGCRAPPELLARVLIKARAASQFGKTEDDVAGDAVGVRNGFQRRRERQQKQRRPRRVRRWWARRGVETGP